MPSTILNTFRDGYFGDSMNIAYLIIAHNTPNHCKRLIEALSSHRSTFFIHVDKKARLEDFSGIAGSNVHFLRDRIPVYWGDFSQVEAILAMLRAATEHGTFDRIVLMSGSDYPLRSVSFIEDFFLANKDVEYMHLVSVPSVIEEKPISRLTTYRLRQRDGEVVNFAKKALMAVGILPRHRNYKAGLGDMSPYAGPGSWAITREAAEYILAFVHDNPNFVKFFSNTDTPDEYFFHTIIGNSQFMNRVTTTLTYADWTVEGQRPAIISERHFEYFRGAPYAADDGGSTSGPKLFARKFPDDSAELVSKLIEQVHKV